jgi:hypothetical protein
VGFIKRPRLGQLALLHQQTRQFDLKLEAVKRSVLTPAVELVILLQLARFVWSPLVAANLAQPEQRDNESPTRLHLAQQGQPLLNQGSPLLLVAQGRRVSTL